MDRLIEEFIEELKLEGTIKNTVNQYSTEFIYSSITCNNLLLYLKNIAITKPKIMFVGEAPGYKGCKLTGIPFTSEKLLRSKLNNTIIGIDKGYKVKDEQKTQSEISATVMWNAFENYGFYPLLWNAFPFHPYKEENINSNRKPTKEELQIGKKYLDLLIRLYEIKVIYAIGNVAQETFLKMGKNVEKIRHPSMGGKKEFLEGVNKLCSQKLT